jgi:acetyl esterase
MVFRVDRLAIGLMTMPKSQPLHDLISRIRRPSAMREIMASALRSIYMRDPFSESRTDLAPTPQHLRDLICIDEQTIADISCAIYQPTTLISAAASNNLPPLIIYMHGGGFVVGCSQDTDYITRQLSHQSQAIVVSINYALTPEAPFPQALQQCQRVLQQCFATMRGRFDPDRVFLAGDSAGGNLALAIACNDFEPKPPIAGLILLAPWLDMHLEKYDSYNTLARSGVVYDSPFMAYARAAYVDYADWSNPLASPIFFAFDKWPRTLIVCGTDDPLIDQTLAVRNAAHNQGCDHIKVVAFAEMPHCFYSFPGLFAEEAECFAEIEKFVSANFVVAEAS